MERANGGAAPEGVAPTLFPKPNVRLPDFGQVLTKLRGLLRAVYETGDDPTSHQIGLAALMAAEEVMVSQALCLLIDHLIFHEQYIKAVHLLAYSTPMAVMRDPEVKKRVDRVMEIAETIKDPETETAAFYLENVHATEDAYIAGNMLLQQRAEYWFKVVRLSLARTAMEFSTGCGIHPVQGRRLSPYVTWTGMDVSAKQVASNNEQMKRLGLPVEFKVQGDPEWYGRFDCVAVLDTLEHTAWPHELLDQAEKYCAQNGLVVVSIPNGPWSLFTPNDTNVGAGQHIATNSIGAIVTLLGTRGTVIDFATIKSNTPPWHNNGVCVVTYMPKSVGG